MLVPFNIIVLFTRILSRFHFIKIKALLDAYQGPYKVRFYYWTGLQLLMQAVCNLTIGSIIVSAISAVIGLHGVVIKNFQELLYITSLQIL